MKIGTLKIEMCNDCPAYGKWGGEWYEMECRFGAFDEASGEKEIPENCPLKEIDKSK